MLAGFVGQSPGWRWRLGINGTGAPQGGTTEKGRFC